MLSSGCQRHRGLGSPAASSTWFLRNYATNVFCPENGDPAQIKAKLYVDEARFAMGDGQGFLLTAVGDGVAITPRPGSESEVPRLDELLNDTEQGLPFRAADLPGRA